MKSILEENYGEMFPSTRNNHYVMNTIHTFSVVKYFMIYF